MENPLFWLGLSLSFVAISFTAILFTFIPLIQELVHTARSTKKLLDTLNQELPETFAALRMTNSELVELGEEVKDGVKSASGAVKNIDRTIKTAKQQAENVKTTGRSFWAGVKAGVSSWKNYQEEEEKNAE